MSQLRISIVTPSFNQVRFLEHTIRSVMSQNYENLEYVIIDGGSTDGSVEVIKQYAPHLAYWRSERDEGHGSALNEGFRQTTGEIMGWLNSDDLYLPWTLSTVAEIFASHPEVDWITGTNAIWDEKGRMVNAFRTFKNKYDFLLGRYEWIQQESTFWRRSLWEAGGSSINETYKFMVDGELWSRFFLHARLYHARCVLGGFRQWAGNRSASQIEACRTEMRQCIATMQQSCDTQTLKNAAKLRRVSSTPKSLRKTVDKLLHLSLPALRLETAYDVLTFEGNEWKHRRHSFI